MWDSIPNLCGDSLGCPAKRSKAESSTGHWPLTTAFLHFLCNPCAQSTHPIFPQISPPLPPLTEPRPCTRLSAISPTRFLILVDLPKSVATIFLNCTKNTELTARSFARTFTLALSTKMNREIGRRQKPAAADQQSTVRHKSKTES